eukprot:3498267-Amphidinium_carterae.1
MRVKADQDHQVAKDCRLRIGRLLRMSRQGRSAISEAPIAQDCPSSGGHCFVTCNPVGSLPLGGPRFVNPAINMGLAFFLYQ